MSEWQPIESYDALPAKKRPSHVVFYFKTMLNGQTFLPPILEMTRRYGSRTCTHWFELPAPPKEQS